MSIDIWGLGPKAAAYRLCLSGFTPGEAERLVALKIRYDRGELRELTAQGRLRFARWLAEHGRFDGDLPFETVHGGGSSQ